MELQFLIKTFQNSGGDFIYSLLNLSLVTNFREYKDVIEFDRYH